MTEPRTPGPNPPDDDPAPQLEDGYLQLANVLFELLIFAPFFERERQLLMYLIRYSYGFQGKMLRTSLYKLSFDLGFATPQKCKQALEPLIKGNVIEIVSGELYGQRPMTLKLQKRWRRWTGRYAITPAVEAKLSKTKPRGLTTTVNHEGSDDDFEADDQPRGLTTEVNHEGSPQPSGLTTKVNREGSDEPDQPPGLTTTVNREGSEMPPQPGELTTKVNRDGSFCDGKPAQGAGFELAKDMSNYIDHDGDHENGHGHGSSRASADASDHAHDAPAGAHAGVPDGPPFFGPNGAYAEDGYSMKRPVEAEDEERGQSPTTPLPPASPAVSLGRLPAVFLAHLRAKNPRIDVHPDEAVYMRQVCEDNGITGDELADYLETWVTAKADRHWRHVHFLSLKAAEAAKLKYQPQPAQLRAVSTTKADDLRARQKAIAERPMQEGTA